MTEDVNLGVTGSHLDLLGTLPLPGVSAKMTGRWDITQRRGSAAAPGSLGGTNGTKIKVGGNPLAQACSLSLCSLAVTGELLCCFIGSHQWTQMIQD